MLRSVRMRSGAWLLVVTACAGDANARLADLPDVRVVVQGLDPSTAVPTGFLWLFYDERQFRFLNDDECAILDDSLTARLDGASLVRTSLGGLDDFGGCAPAAFRLTSQFGGTPTFVISDDSMTVTAEFGLDAFAPHVPTLRAPTSWQFSAGQTVRIGWSHPADLADLGADPAEVGFHTGKTENNNSFDLDAQYSGDEIVFTIPAPPPVTGPGFIVFRFGYFSDDATTCTGAASCRYSASRGAAHSVTIVP